MSSYTTSQLAHGQVDLCSSQDGSNITLDVDVLPSWEVLAYVPIVICPAKANELEALTSVLP